MQRSPLSHDDRRFVLEVAALPNSVDTIDGEIQLDACVEQAREVLRAECLRIGKNNFRLAKRRRSRAKTRKSRR